MTVTSALLLIILGPLGHNVIAVVGVSNIVMYNAWALFSGIGHTVNYMVAQNYGENQLEKAIERTYIALYFCVLVSIPVIIAGLTLPEALLRWVGDAELAETGAGYLEIRFYIMVLGIFIFVFQGFFGGIGDTKTPMVLSIIGGAITILFTYAFAYGSFGIPELGLTGAGYGFLIGEVVSLLGYVYVFFVTLNPRFKTRTWVKPKLAETKLIFAESGKLGVQEFAMSVSMLIFTFFVGTLGAQALAANEIALNVMSVGFMPAFAFGATATILVGQAVGKGSPFEARRYGTDTAVLGSLLLLVLGGAEFIFAEQIAGIYSNDPDMIALVAMLIKVSAFMQVFDGWFNFYAGCLRGLGETTFLFVAAVIFRLCRIRSVVLSDDFHL